MTFEAMENALVVAVYTALGQSVTYTPSGGSPVTIYAIVDNGSEQIGFNSNTSEEITRARLKVSDVAMPKRGDTLVLANSAAYTVDGVEPENNIEWFVTMTEDAR